MVQLLKVVFYCFRPCYLTNSHPLQIVVQSTYNLNGILTNFLTNSHSKLPLSLNIPPTPSPNHPSLLIVVAMTTAARPTFEPARGGTGRGEGDLSALSKQYSSRDLPGHTKLKYRYEHFIVLVLDLPNPHRGRIEPHKFCPLHIF